MEQKADVEKLYNKEQMLRFKTRPRPLTVKVMIYMSKYWFQKLTRNWWMYSYFVEDNFLVDKIYRWKDTGKFM